MKILIKETGCMEILTLFDPLDAVEYSDEFLAAFAGYPQQELHQMSIQDYYRWRDLTILHQELNWRIFDLSNRYGRLNVEKVINTDVDVDDIDDAGDLYRIVTRALDRVFGKSRTDRGYL